MEMNNEAKVRRSTRSVVVGTAKVMSYEDIEEARAKRTAKDALKGKGKRGRKRKSAAPDEGESHSQPEPEPDQEPEPEVARAAKKVRKSTEKRARKRRSIAEADQPEIAPEPDKVSELAWAIPPET